jgi:hypothetical protein
MTCLLRLAEGLAQLGDRAASKATVSVAYRQAVAVPTPNPAVSPGERLALAQLGQRQQGLLPGAELAPGRPDLPAVTADHPGGVGQGLRR